MEQKKFFNELENAIKELTPWENHTGPSWGDRFARLYYYKWRYLLFLFSRIKPIVVRTKLFFGATLYCRLPEHFYFYLSGFFPEKTAMHEKNLTKFIIKNITPNDIFFDIGANCGFYTVLVNYFTGGRAQIHTFEPTAYIVELLEKNTRGMQNVFINEMAVFSSSGILDFYLDEKFSVGNTVIASENRKKVSVLSIALDDYCMVKGIRPTFLKIDVEGSEGEVIQGAINTIKKFKPIIALEIWKERNESHKKATRELFSLGYEMYMINNDGELDFVAKSQDEFAKMQFKKDQQVYDNFIFKKRNGVLR